MMNRPCETGPFAGNGLVDKALRWLRALAAWLRRMDARILFAGYGSAGAILCMFAGGAERACSRHVRSAGRSRSCFV